MKHPDRGVYTVQANESVGAVRVEVAYLSQAVQLPALARALEASDIPEKSGKQLIFFGADDATSATAWAIIQVADCSNAPLDIIRAAAIDRLEEIGFSGCGY